MAAVRMVSPSSSVVGPGADVVFSAEHQQSEGRVWRLPLAPVYFVFDVAFAW